MIKGIKLSEVIQSLELLRDLCSIHESCTTCWLYDQEEKETACFLLKVKEDSLAGNIEAALENIAQEHSCMMPECPYCPTCGYGHIDHQEDAMLGEEGLLSQWHCMYDPKVGGGNGNGEKD